jgi:hypothetical protein
MGIPVCASLLTSARNPPLLWEQIVAGAVIEVFGTRAGMGFGGIMLNSVSAVDPCMEMVDIQMEYCSLKVLANLKRDCRCLQWLEVTVGSGVSLIVVNGRTWETYLVVIVSCLIAESKGSVTLIAAEIGVANEMWL